MFTTIWLLSLGAWVEPARAADTFGGGRFHVAENSQYTIVDSVLDSLRFMVTNMLHADDRGHLVSRSSFVDPRGEIMHGHDFGDLEGPGWAANAVGGAQEICLWGTLLGRPAWQQSALRILDHVFEAGFIDRESGLIGGCRFTTTGDFCLNYLTNSAWFCPGSLAKVACQLLLMADQIPQDPRAQPMRDIAVRRAAWIDGHVELVPNGWFPRRTTSTGAVYRKSPTGGNDPFWQTSADGLSILQLQAGLTPGGLADYRAARRVKARVFREAGGIFGSINHDTYDPQENVACRVAYRVLLPVARLVDDAALRDFAYHTCLAGRTRFQICENRNGVATQGLLYREDTRDTSYLWEKPDAALACFEAAVGQRSGAPDRARAREMTGLTILRAAARRHDGPYGFLTEGVDWNDHVGQPHHFDQAKCGAIQYTEPFLNNQHIAELAWCCLTHLADVAAERGGTAWRDVERNVFGTQGRERLT